MCRFRKSKFFRTWDPRVLDRYLEYGLREVPTAIYPISGDVKLGAVTLTTTKHQESWTYLRSNFLPRTADSDPSSSSIEQLVFPDIRPDVEGLYLFHRGEVGILEPLLPILRPSVLYIFGELSPMSTPALQDRKMSITGTAVGGSGGTTRGEVKKVVLEKGSHIVPCERVGECAAAAAEWLGERLSQFRVEEQLIRGYRSEKSERDMLVLSPRWKSGARKPSYALREAKGKL